MKQSGNCRRLPLFLLLPLLLLSISIVLNQRTYLSAVPNRYKITGSTPSAAATVVDGDSTNKNIQYDDAEVILRRSFLQSYGRILPCDDNPSWMKGRNTNIIAKECIQETRDYIISENVTVPWWFQTLLRDITGRGGGIYVPWHHFDTTKPLLNFCTIDKVATSQWRKVFCELNKEDCVNTTKGSCGRNKCAFRTLQTMPEEAPWAVFTRDPLERLLSGYLDKCHDPSNRRRQEHCAPNIVTNPMEGLENGKNKPYPNLLDSIKDEGKDKQMFEAYVDIMPLKWNAHFVPQALHCDLHRNINQYDFVGDMGRDFYFDLDRMANQFGGQLPEVLNNTFSYMDHVKNGNHNNTGKTVGGHASHAPAQVKRFYTARTVRKALEYFSIDYITLGLRVPDWAKEMLKNETL